MTRNYTRNLPRTRSQIDLFSGMNNDDLLYFTNIDNSDSEHDA